MADPSVSVNAGSTNGTPAAQSPSVRQPLVMQLIVNRSLIGTPGSTWTLGPMMAQAAHAATAVTIKTLATSSATQEYVHEDNLAEMHKVVLQPPSKGALTDLNALSRKLTEERDQWVREHRGDDNVKGNADEEFPDHYLWIEQPENIPTCLAIAPNRKPAALKKILNKCSLLRD
ncbi:unnamed protein product [Parajaminaea phylloscopi]